MKKPTKPGVWWVSLDDGGKVAENVLVQVRRFMDTTSFDEGVMVRFLDDSGRMADMNSIDEEVLKPFVLTQTGFMSGSSKTDEVRVKWLTEVLLPKNAPEVGKDV